MVCTWDQAIRSAVAVIEPTVISARPPWWSSHRPTGMATRAPARTEAVSAPVTAVVDAPRLAAMGVIRTG
ncbi:hypothetical protein JD76_01088 [Micromonospora endolithica]|nr:hypothetical protein JD76_01088 [Micromonospora endolithica]